MLQQYFNNIHGILKIIVATHELGFRFGVFPNRPPFPFLHYSARRKNHHYPKSRDSQTPYGRHNVSLFFLIVIVFCCKGSIEPFFLRGSQRKAYLVGFFLSRRDFFQPFIKSKKLLSQFYKIRPRALFGRAGKRIFKRLLPIHYIEPKTAVKSVFNGVDERFDLFGGARKQQRQTRAFYSYIFPPCFSV